VYELETILKSENRKRSAAALKTLEQLVNKDDSKGVSKAAQLVLEECDSKTKLPENEEHKSPLEEGQTVASKEKSLEEKLDIKKRYQQWRTIKGRSVTPFLLVLVCFFR
jgi:hypothetical protein